jgi:hypothetical protein
MPRRSILSVTERESLLALPNKDDDLLRYYTFSESDLSVIRQRRGNHNRLGFAVQLCYLRHPGFALPPEAAPPTLLLLFVGMQLGIDPKVWPQYAERPETRREHLLELQAWLGLRPFSAKDHRQLVLKLSELAQQTDRGIVLAEALVEILRQQHAILPVPYVIERVCSEALTRGTRRIYKILTSSLTKHHRYILDKLLVMREGSKDSVLIWLRQPPGPPKPKHILIHLERLKVLNELNLPEGVESAVHQSRLLKLAREGAQMTAQHLRDLELERRYATLVAILIDTRATLIDEIIDLHNRFMGCLFSRAKRNHADQFHESGKSINNKIRLYSCIGRALLDARQFGNDPFAAIEAIIPWDAFTESIAEAERLAQPEDFNYLALVSDGFNQLRRYTPTLLSTLEINAIPVPIANDLIKAIDVLRIMNGHQIRRIPDNAPISFVRKSWESLVCTKDGLDRRFYELCVLSDIK